MTDCRVCSLYSSSGGNSFFFDIKGKKILIDAGKNARTLCRALSDIGSDMSQISAIFVTHEHGDHISALEVISKKYSLPIHMTFPSASKFDRYTDSPIHKNLVRHEQKFEVDMEEFKIHSFPTPHDSLMSVGYIIEFSDESGNHSIGLATDIGYVTDEIRDELSGCEAVVLESNFDEEMLDMGPYPYDLKKRIRSKRGHLSNRESAEFACKLTESGTRSFLLAHLSLENNLPDIALDEYQATIADSNVVIIAADPCLPTEMMFAKEGEHFDFCESNNSGNA